MWLSARKTTPGVRDGRVQRKNEWGRTPDRDAPLVIRETPLRGFKHLLTVGDVEAFIELLPPELMHGIEHVVLSRDTHCLGWCWRDTVAVCAWPRELHTWWPASWRDEHWASLQLYGVPMQVFAGRILCEFSEEQVRAFQLLRVLTHELGHHADRKTTGSGRISRGEPFAERFAVQWEAKLWAKYVNRFGCP